MKEIFDQIVPGKVVCNKVIALDDPGDGGANHRYEIDLGEASDGMCGPVIEFQNGPIGEVGVNGIHNEDLMAIVIDRLRGFQSGKFACRENAIALTKLEEAMLWLKKRTLDRVAKGIEGTHKVS